MIGENKKYIVNSTILGSVSNAERGVGSGLVAGHFDYVTDTQPVQKDVTAIMAYSPGKDQKRNLSFYLDDSGIVILNGGEDDGAVTINNSYMSDSSLNSSNITFSNFDSGTINLKNNNTLFSVDQSIGSTTVPIYLDETGTFKPITSYSGIASNATTATTASNYSTTGGIATKFQEITTTISQLQTTIEQLQNRIKALENK